MGKRVTHFLLLCGAILSGVFLSRAGMPSNRLSGNVFTFRQDTLSGGSPSAPQGAKERIYIVNVDLWSFDKDINPDAQILTGNVQFRHQDANMYCDSAYLYEATNRFEAFGNVRIEQGDTVNIYCDYLNYDGMTLLAKLRDHVRMEHRETTLFTDSLDYDRMSGVAYYSYSGVIADTLNTLSSIYGEYSTVTRQANFRDQVVLENPNFTLKSDTLHYDTETKIANILGPTRIDSDSGYILATKGYYNTELDRSYLMNRAKVYSGDRFMTGDSIYYDRQGQLAEMYGNVILRDTLQRAELQGNYAEYHEDTEYGFAIDSAYVVDYSSSDTLYAHAKRLEMMKADSATTLYKGTGNVRLFRKDVQAVSDSIIFNSADSTIRCLGRPFIWNLPSQITGDTIIMYMKGGQMDYAHIFENAFTTQQVDSTHFHQMRGTEIFAYFNDNEIDSVRTTGNAETIYYDVDKDSVVTAHVKTQSSAILMKFQDRELVQIILLDKTNGRMTPAALLKPEDLYFPDFVWFPEGRPTSFTDIFRETPKPGKSVGDRQAEALAAPPPTEEEK